MSLMFGQEKSGSPRAGVTSLPLSYCCETGAYFTQQVEKLSKHLAELDCPEPQPVVGTCPYLLSDCVASWFIVFGSEPSNLASCHLEAKQLKAQLQTVEEARDEATDQPDREPSWLVGS